MGVVGADARDGGITEAQRQAVEEAMRLILEEDRERGVGLEEFECAGCGESRAVAGSVAYQEVRLCNDCATQYELGRVEGTVRSCAEYLGQRRHRRRRDVQTAS